MTCPDFISFCQASLRHKLPLIKEKDPPQGGLQASPKRLVERTLLDWAVFGDLGSCEEALSGLEAPGIKTMGSFMSGGSRQV